MKHDHLSGEGLRGHVPGVDAHDCEPKTVCHKRLRPAFPQLPLMRMTCRCSLARVRAV